MSDTREAIMAAARTTVQARGYNGLSFRELAKQVGIKSASIHHHFPTKTDLVAAIVRRYRDVGQAALDVIRSESADPAVCLRRYATGFRAALENDNRMCLCGLLAAEYHELPDRVKIEVQAFVDCNIDWLTDVLSSSGLPADSARRRAVAIYAAISGAQLTARAMADCSVFDAVVETYRIGELVPG